jgi:DNA-binding beta-propeller fold protein YncE
LRYAPPRRWLALWRPGSVGHGPGAGFAPLAIVLTLDGADGYVTDGGTGMQPGDTVTPFSTKTDTVGKAIKVGLSPVAIALTP